MKKNVDVNTALKIIIKAAKNYDAFLNGKHFCIVYHNEDNWEYVEVAFHDINFLHLTGVKSKLSAKMFYSAAISGKLSIKDIIIDSKGKAQQKLIVLPYLHELLYNNCMIGNFINSGIYVKSDYFVGDTKAFLSLGFIKGKKKDIPITLYNEDVKTLSRPVHKVFAIFMKKRNSKKYEECTYISKEQSEKIIRDFINNEV